MVHSLSLSSRPRCAFIDKAGQVILELTDYDDVRSFSGGLAPVLVAEKGWGFIDKSGKLRIEPQFENVNAFSEGLAGVTIDGKGGFIDGAGEIVIEPEYAILNSFSEGLAVVVTPFPEKPAPELLPGQRRVLRSQVLTISLTSRANDTAPLFPIGKEILIIDKSGQVLARRDFEEEIQIKFDGDARFSEGVLEAFDKRSKLFGFVNLTCQFVIEPTYEQVGRFSEGLARVAVERDEEKIGFIDRSGRFAIPPKFNTDADFRNSSNFSDGLALITEGLRPTFIPKEKFGYINKAGEVQLITDFDEAYSFSDGLALVKDERERWGFIDKTGSIAIAPQFRFAKSFSDGLALIYL